MVEVGIPQDDINKLIEKYRRTNPEWLRMLRLRHRNHLYEHLSSELQEKIKE